MSATDHYGRTTTRGTSVLATLLSFPIACFTLALLTDLAYWTTANLMWHHFSSWLLLAGLVGGGLAIVVWIVRQIGSRDTVNWPAAIAGLLVLVAAFLNSLVHAGDGWTGVVPWGIALSALTVVLMLASALLGRMASGR